MSVSIIDNLVPLVSFGGLVASVVCIGLVTPVVAKVGLVAAAIFFTGAFCGSFGEEDVAGNAMKVGIVALALTVGVPLLVLVSAAPMILTALAIMSLFKFVFLV